MTILINIKKFNMHRPGTNKSSSLQENGDATEPDRPLKKARFAWEVKGKYHLRNEMSDKKPAVNDSADLTKAGSSSGQCGNERNIEILGDYLLNQEYPNPSTCMLPSSSLSTDLSYPRYVSSLEKAASESSSSIDDTPLHNPVGYSYKDYEDMCILRWQARQLSKCFVDNTINSVLDSFMFTPLPAHLDNNGVLALDAAEFNNNLPGDNSIENEAILMAISAHGLQNNSNSSISNANESHNSSNELFLSPPSSPLEKESNRKKNQEENSSNDWTFTNDDSAPIFCSESSNSSYQYLSEDNVNSNSYEGEENALNDMNAHYDFLDAAVSFAIQYKGLTSYGTDYG